MRKLFIISVVALCTLGLVGAAMGQNLLVNPGFETWTAGPGGPPDSWYSSNSSLTGTQEGTIVNSGTYSCNLTWTTTSTCYLIQDVAVTAGLDYTFSFMAYDNTADGRLRCALRWFQADNTTFISGYYGDYTVDGTSWQALSSGPQTAPAGAAFAHVEIRAYDVSGWPGTATCYADDAVFEEAVAPEPDTVTIYDIQFTTDIGSDCYDSPYDGQVVWTKGIVSFVNPGTYPNFYIQDAATPFSGVFVFDSSINPAMGDEVLMKCEVDEYYGMTELKNVSDYTILSTGNIPWGPTPISSGDLSGGCNAAGEQWEGMLVKVIDPVCTQDINSYGEWYVDDGTGEAQLDDDYYAFDPYVGQPFLHICGVVDYSYSEYELLPRDVYDICFPVAIELASFEAAAGDGYVTLTWRTTAEIEAHSFNIHRNDEVIATVEAAGEAHDYTYVDRQVTNGQTYTYQLSDVDLSGHETLHQMICSVTPNTVPGEYALEQNYPNPFNPSTEIAYAVPAEAHVTLKVYNLLGQEVASLVDEVKEAGRHTINWNAADQASGVYFYSMQTDDFSATKKMVFMK
jgi:hypothetical protein